jgi:hypothetical protein
LQLLASYAAPLARVLGVERLDAQDWLVVVVCAAVPAVVGQTIKTARKWRPRGI